MYRFLPILLFAVGLAVTTDDIYDNSWALIIGIDKYENVSNLDYAVKDANTIASLLKDNFNFPSKNVTVLLNEEATFTNIRNGLSKVSSSAKENDRVLIYFAGHGETMDLPDGGEMGYLLPIDGKRDNLFATSILMDDLKKISSMTKAKHMLFLIDACYGGLAATGARGLSSTTPNFIDKITNDKSRQIITAGGRGEQVIEKSEWGHSAFTMNLIRALENGKADLNEDGYITGDELGLFLKEKVTIDSENKQTPQSRRFTSHEGEFVFINNVNIEKQIIHISQSDQTSIIESISDLIKKIEKLENNIINKEKLFFPKKQYGIELNPIYFLTNLSLYSRALISGSINYFPNKTNIEYSLPIYYKKGLEGSLAYTPRIFKLGIQYRTNFAQKKYRSIPDSDLSDGLSLSIGMQFVTLKGYSCMQGINSTNSICTTNQEEFLPSTAIIKKNYFGLVLGAGYRVFSNSGIYFGFDSTIGINMIESDLAIYNINSFGRQMFYYINFMTFGKVF